MRAERGLDLIATGHTASDQAETVLYRLASSPGRRSLLGIAERSGRLFGPLLVVTRSDTHDYCRADGLGWCEDESNLDTSLARNRIRHEILPALREIHPAAEQNIVATAEELREEAGLLDLALRRGARALRGRRQPAGRRGVGAGRAGAAAAPAASCAVSPSRRPARRWRSARGALPSWNGWRSGPAAPTSTCPAASGPPASTA